MFCQPKGCILSKFPLTIPFDKIFQEKISMSLISRNPATGETLATFREMDPKQIDLRLKMADKAFLLWRKTSFEYRSLLFRTLASRLRERKHFCARTITLEMGKPIREAYAEVEKCALVCEYYAEHAEEFLAAENISTDAQKSYVRFDPLGAILAIMPWNFPFWQVFRFAAPTLMAGNVGLLKHASNVPRTALVIEELFSDAGFPHGIFQNLAITSDKVAAVIKDPRVKAVTLTGSEYAGSQTAMIAGESLKKTVLELGGSDPFIVLKDADIVLAAEQGAISRLQNCGQSCIAAKRFIVVQNRMDEFLDCLKREFEKRTIGNPLDEYTDIGPLATESIRDEVEKQVAGSVALGARVITGGERGLLPCFYLPTILADVVPGMPAYHEEIFGPVASVICVKDADEAILVANDTSFGLGASLWTKNLRLAARLIPEINTGQVFVNSMVKSDPRLPFGGIGKSGYGRELSFYGIREFVNTKTVYMK